MKTMNQLSLCEAAKKAYDEAVTRSQREEEARQVQKNEEHKRDSFEAVKRLVGNDYEMTWDEETQTVLCDGVRFRYREYYIPDCGYNRETYVCDVCPRCMSLIAAPYSRLNSFIDIAPQLEALPDLVARHVCPDIEEERKAVRMAEANRTPEPTRSEKLEALVREIVEEVMDERAD